MWFAARRALVARGGHGLAVRATPWRGARGLAVSADVRAARPPLVAWRGARGLAVCADILVERLGVTPERAARAEAMLLPNIRRDLTREQAEKVSNFSSRL